MRETWVDSNEKREFRSFMSDFHLWMQALSDQGEQMLAKVESTVKFDNNVIAFDCSAEEFVPGPAQNDIQRTTENSASRREDRI